MDMNYIKYYEKYLNLRKVGRGYVATCPFHADKRPSLFVDPQLGGYHCFGCEAKGNLLSFLKRLKYEGIANTTQDIIEFKKMYRAEKLAANFSEPQQKQTTKEDTTTSKTRDFEIEKEKRKYEAMGYELVESYRYYTLDGELTYIKHRFENKSKKELPLGEKFFIFQDSEGKIGLNSSRQILYGLEQLFVKTFEPIQEFWLAEGEKCKSIIDEKMGDAVDDIIVLGFVTVNDFKDYKELFANRDVVIFEDNDTKGEINSENITELLKNEARTIKVMKFSEYDEGYDVADFLQEYSYNDLLELIAKTPYTVNNELQDTQNELIELKQNESKLKPASSLPARVSYQEIEGMDIPEEKLFYDLFTHDLNLLIGRAGVGKSYVLSRLAIEYTQTTHNKALLIFFEDKLNHNFKQRVKIAKDDYCKEHPDSKVDLSLVEATFDYDNVFLKKYGEIYPNLEGFIKDLDEYKFIGIDPLLSFAGVSELESGLLRQALVDISKLLKNRDNIVIFTHHVTKYNTDILNKIITEAEPNYEDLLTLTDIARGSGEITNVARNVVLLIQGQEKGELRLIVTKSNVMPVGKENKINFEWNKYKPNLTIAKAQQPKIVKGVKYEEEF